MRYGQTSVFRKFGLQNQALWTLICVFFTAILGKFLKIALLFRKIWSSNVFVMRYYP